MYKNPFVPAISGHFFCIVNRDSPELAAMISSYLQEEGSYLPMFEFPVATNGRIKSKMEDNDDDLYISHRSESFGVLAYNAIKKLKGCENLILAGLSENQKSYLTFLDKFNVIEIDNLDNVEFSLGAFRPDMQAFFLCRPDQLLEGLYYATFNKLKLQYSITADDVPALPEDKDGIVIIERIIAASAVIAVNYAISVNATIAIVPEIADQETEFIRNKIQSWKKNIVGAEIDLLDNIRNRIQGIYFPRYSFGTFFTEGVPYSLVLNDIIPFSYVHFWWRPDFFVFNCIFYEHHPNLSAAIVFSPLIFKDKEETGFVINSLEAQELYVRRLLDQDASVYNIDMHIQEFPFDLLHICSHGGEVSGYTYVLGFEDNVGNQHEIEYDEVVSFAPSGTEAKIAVHEKQIFRSIDGVIWGSPEFDAKDFPSHVLDAAQKAIQQHKKPKEGGIKKDMIEDSCSISCKDFIYQGMFDHLAGWATSPIIFNNTCWSWSGIADSFLMLGARGYIGTLWNINNNVAAKSAEKFYSELFNMSVLDALQFAIMETRGTKDEHIYIYWGLHLTCFKKQNNFEQNKRVLVSRILKSFHRWLERYEETTDDKIRELIKRLERWNQNQLYKEFKTETEELISSAKEAYKKRSL